MIARNAALAAGSLLLASGCQTAAGGGATITLVTTDPAGALVRVEGFGECEAPCTIELDAPRNLTVAKAGYQTQRMVLPPGVRKLDVKLELAAPTKGVDSGDLPEL